MDLHLKQWRNQGESEHQPSYAKIPKLGLDPQRYQQQSQSEQSALPLFGPEQPDSRITLMSASTDPTSDVTRVARMGGGFFSRTQWQELELQALIFRYMLAGAAIPLELLQPMMKKNLVENIPYLNFIQPTMFQSGYWGRAALDPEPGRCRRTDGKKWRCSRDIAPGHKYCERHLHRGRNRSRKPVESSTAAANGGASAASSTASFAPKTAVAGGGTPFTLSKPLPPAELHNQRSSQSITGKGVFEGRSGMTTSNSKSSDGQVLRHFFDDWPRPIQNADNASVATASATCLTISTPGNPSSDTSLKLSTGNTNEPAAELRLSGMNWGSGWGMNQASSMGGPLAEVLRSSAPISSSPKSVLHQLNRCTGLSEASYIST